MENLNEETEVMEVSALVAIQEGEINSQIATAKRFPRSIDDFRKRALGMVTLDQDIATSCFYKLKRGSKIIEGPSVRLAEIALACWKNLRAGSRVISIDDKYVRSQGAFMDLETNSAVSVEVVRRITDKTGKRYDDDLIMVTSNAANAIAFRNAAFKVIPGIFIQELLEAARKCARGDLKTLESRRDTAFDAFKALGIGDKKVLLWLGRKGKSEIDLQDLENLFGLLTAIKDGETTVAETFDKLSSKPSVSDPVELPAGQESDPGRNGNAPGPDGGLPAAPPAPSRNGKPAAAVINDEDNSFNDFQAAVFDIVKRNKKTLKDVTEILKKSGYAALSAIPSAQRSAALKAIETGLKC